MVESTKYLVSFFLRLAILCAVMIHCSHINALEREILTLAGDYRCPYNCDSKDQKEGFIVELVKRVLRIHSIHVEYKLMPWGQALDLLEDGQVDGVLTIGADYNKSQILISPPLAFSNVFCYTRPNSQWVFDGVSSFKNRKIGIITSYIPNNNIAQYVSMNLPQHMNLFIVEEGERATTKSIENLIDGKIDVLIEDELIVDHYVKSNDLSSHIRKAGAVDTKRTPLYIGFSVHNEKASTYLKYLENGIISLKATGEYQELKNKYGIQ